MHADNGRYLDTVAPQAIQWLSPGRLAFGFVTMLDGDPGLGKSTILADWAARVSTGRPLMDAYAQEPGGVVLLSAEDHVAATIRPRLEAAEADLSRVLVLEGHRDPIRPQDGIVPPSIPDDLWLIRQAVQDCHAKLLIVDPIMAFMGEQVDTHKDASVRRALAPLKSLAEEENVAVVMVRHLNKSAGGSALYRGQGSIGISGAARIVLMAGRDPEDETRLLLACVKSNIAKEAPTLAVRLSTSVENPAVAVVTYEGETETRADDLVTGIDREEREERMTAREWVRQVLDDGALTAKELFRLANAQHISEKRVRTALRQCNASWRREGFGRESEVLWHLTGKDYRARPVVEREGNIITLPVPPRGTPHCIACNAPVAADQRLCPACMGQQTTLPGV